MFRRLLVLVLLALGRPLLADGPPRPPSLGPVATVTTAQAARLQTAQGAVVEVPAGATLVLLSMNPGAGTVRVRYLEREGTLPASALKAEALGPVPSPSAGPPPTPVPLPPGTAPLTITPSDFANLPPEVRAALRATPPPAKESRPSGLPSPKTAPVGPLAPGASASSGPPPPPPGGVLTFRTKEEAEQWLAAQKARQDAEAKARATAPSKPKTP